MKLASERPQDFTRAASKAKDLLTRPKTRNAGPGDFASSLREDLRSYDGPGFRVGILLWPSFTMVAFAGFVDALRLAADMGDSSRQLLCRWEVMAESSAPILSSCGLRVIPMTRFKDPEQYDYVVVVAGRTQSLDDAPASNFDYLRRASKARIPLIGLCTGSFVLAGLGLLDNYRACVANFHYREFAERFPQVSLAYDQLYCIDRDRITCAGGAASIDLAAHLIGLRCGNDRAIKIHRTIIVWSSTCLAHSLFGS